MSWIGGSIFMGFSYPMVSTVPTCTLDPYLPSQSAASTSLRNCACVKQPFLMTRISEVLLMASPTRGHPLRYFLISLWTLFSPDPGPAARIASAPTANYEWPSHRVNKSKFAWAN
ncbi:hypothetical protein HD806DRAFT_211276 [Xylariaceae sp. AK1471]|nr:hypothetical protein HD806DRAFT_211276 [Xylariaceae sp. AK1471]